MKPRFLKSIKTLKQEPKNDSSNIQNILIRDIAGYNGNDIAGEVGLSAARVSIIRNSPLYLERKEALWGQLRNQLVDKKVDDVVGEDVKAAARKHIVGLTKGLVNIAQEGKSDFSKLAATKELYKRAGLDKAEVKEQSIMIEQKLGQRLNKVMDYDESRKDDRSAKVTITEKVSS